MKNQVEYAGDLYCTYYGEILYGWQMEVAGSCLHIVFLGGSLVVTWSLDIGIVLKHLLAILIAWIDTVSIDFRFCLFAELYIIDP